MPFADLTRLLPILFATEWLLLSVTFAQTRSDNVDFDRDIRPILSDVCYKCHGPDEKQRDSELRLDRKESALGEIDGHRPIVPGDPKASELYRRIISQDKDERMPPEDSGRELTGKQIDLLKKWIEQGAKWNEHWAFATLVRPEIPKPDSPLASGKDSWISNPIDAFVLARFVAEGMQPSPAADKSTLIRRVTLDLTGLPPTPEEVDAFVADESPEAYERVVDRLLRSPRYGERMAVMWLDAARYADTSGYQNDGPRDMWRWRDWVIDAFNKNQPFDQFTIEQIAGDLLPNATLDQLIATAFNRNHRGNAEGGIIPEEYQVEYVVDRVETTFTVWLGLTMGCARCHDHKYDPLKQKEFYQAFAYFNNVPEDGRAIKEGNSPPYIKAPTPRQQLQLREFDAKIEELASRNNELQEELHAAQVEWEKSYKSQQLIDWTVTRGLLARYRLDGNVTDEVDKSREAKFPDSAFAKGRVGQAAELSGGSFIDAGDVGNFNYTDKFSLTAWVNAKSENGTILSRMTPVEQGDGYYVHLQDGHIQVNLVKRWLDDSTRVETVDRLPLNKWHHVAVTYDGSRLASGIHVFLDGAPLELNIKLDRINQTFATKEPLRIGGGQSNFAGVIDEVQVYSRDLSAGEVSLMATPESINEVLAVPDAKRSMTQQAKLQAYFLENHAPDRFKSLQQELVQTREDRRTFFENIPTVMVMQEMPESRDTFVLVRGEYNNPSEKVVPSVPSIFPGLPANAPSNRLSFARWLVASDHPLTARVAVNRFWQLYFGSGLVKTTEDFGLQGESPSHLELLDWLATEFIRSGWDVKALQKLIVMSATYRQSSKVTLELLARDPDNRLLARGARFRLPAEMLRDQALAVSGLLKEKVGGSSVKPYQPEGLWMEIATDTEYKQSHGDDLYRRSLYTYWKRTVAPPTMATFDATTREACTVKRSRTNTPLQSLTLMNDVTFVEAARVLAQRAIGLHGQPNQRIEEMFRLATARKPRAAEQKILQAALADYLAHYSANKAGANQLASIGEFPLDEKVDVAELAAYTTLASLILNLDEVVTRE